MRYVYVDYEPETIARSAPRGARNAEIAAWVLENCGLEATSRQITQVKKDNGVVTRGGHNRSRAKPADPVDVPSGIRAAIEAALQHFGIIPEN